MSYNNDNSTATVPSISLVRTLGVSYIQSSNTPMVPTYTPVCPHCTPHCPYCGKPYHQQYPYFFVPQFWY